MNRKLTLFHGSKGGLQGAIRPVSDGACDFGSGFYMGDEPHQPKTLICESRLPVFYTLELNLDGLKILDFEPDADWALFVAYNRGRLRKYEDSALCRRYKRIRSEYDVISGRIADDRMFAVMTMFFQGLIGVPALVESLSALNMGRQYCAVTEKACANVKVVEAQRFSDSEIGTLRFENRERRKAGSEAAERICQRLRREGESFFELIERVVQRGEEKP